MNRSKEHSSSSNEEINELNNVNIVELNVF